MTEPKADQWSVWIGRVVAVMGLAMLLYLVLTIWSGLDHLYLALRNFPMGSHLPLILGLVVLGLFLRGLRWHYYVRYLGWPVPFIPSLIAFMASFAFTATPGKAGEVVKAGLLRSRYNIAMADTTGVLLVERLGDLVAVLVLAAGGLSLLANAWFYFLISLLAVGGLTVGVTNEKIYDPLLNQLGGWPRLEPVARKMLELLQTGRSLLNPIPFVAGLGIAIISWSCEAWALYVVLDGFGLTLPVLTTFSIYGLSTVIGALSMLPGGVGGVEAAMLLMLSGLGIKPATAVAPVVLLRFSTLWFGSLLGFCFMGIWWLVIEPGRPRQLVPEDT
jgi:uncharacterized membrane protein YbhN (UPF0104 family)